MERGDWRAIAARRREARRSGRTVDVGPFIDKRYRDSYLDGFVRGLIPCQIRVLREKAGLTQGALAKRIGTSQSAVA